MILTHVSSFSILPAVVFAIIRFKKINSDYYPFIFILWLALVTEIVSKVLRLYEIPNFLSTNIYSISEGLLYLFFFKNLGILNRSIYLGLSVSLIIFWLVENVFIIGSFGDNYTSYFFIICDFLLVLLAINALNNTFLEEKTTLKSPVFWICIGMIIYFTYVVLIEIFWLYGIKGNLNYFSESVYKIHSLVNILCNLIYAVAVLWMKKKKTFMLQF